ncbi:ribbon-helix-helix domain-containing protein [Wielerella bovis]|uniref:ribbon-helix-helix domain-containing protein n=1 Tax=Wielerella bovis TaxID=2917790 RepID=UPI002019B376|nr:ribbon-helix-helix domain-containing protein [Wielerella bovis]ULJ60805.1 ribbon-helix-helix domain-containing protein [Wielerella bovis]ULJ64031.1 ribbon-helix-helix domain-containing protein [Wielerella bovis]ULJ67507.1 ribbon-helix-helix domain-containing protein [Wielerella bovis]
MKPEKCTAEIKLHLGDTLKADLKTIAARNGFDNLSGFIRHILRLYVYGNLTPNRDVLADNVRDD